MVAGTLKRLRDDHRFAELITRTCGIVFEPGAAQERLFNVVAGRMSAYGIPTPDEYYTLLRREERELQALIELLTVNETYFFREPEYLNLLVEVLIPEYLAKCGDRPVRILCAGCSTGEEPYSLAILLRQHFRAAAERFEITGADIDTKALAIAAHGNYAAPSFRRTDPLLLQGYFEATAGKSYRVREEVRRMVRFEQLNLVEGGAATVGQQDFITYRNVSIYFSAEVQKAIFRRLADLLPEGGALIVGASETLHHDLGLLPLVERNRLFYFSRQPAGRQQAGIRERRAGSAAVKIAVSTAAKAAAPASRPATDPKPGPAPARERRIPVPVRPAPALPATAPHREAAAAADSFAAALAAARQMQYDQALMLAEAAVASDPSTMPLVLKAGLLLQTGRYDEAEGPAEAALDLDPLCAQACLILGIAARNRGDEQGAFRRFREALYGDASCWLAQFYAAEILYAKGEAGRARAGFETVINLLEKGDDQDLTIFPLAYEPGQFLSICRHKLNLMQAQK